MAEWSWCSASRRGTAHEAAGGRREDAHRVGASATGGLFAAVVCDGAGCASLGGQGASIAAWALGGAARRWMAGASAPPSAERVERWMALARLRIAIAAARRGLALADFATTAALAISDGTTTVTSHVGDGAVAARLADGGWTALSWPDHGEHASTTFFLTDQGRPRVRTAVHEVPLDRLALTTDGIERLALDLAAGEPHAAFLEPLAAPLAHSASGRDDALCLRLADFLDCGRVNDRTDDDKTLVLAARRG